MRRTAAARRRRLVVLWLPVLLAVVAAGVLAARGLAARTPPAAQDRPGPVLLVPGFGGGRAPLEPLAAALRAAGRDVAFVRLPGDGTGDLAAQADALDRVAAAALDAGAPSVDVVGFSAGGVVARLWAADGGAQVARRVVSLGAPQHGTSLADTGLAALGRSCPPACRQLATGSAVLRRLNAADETPDGPHWTSVWTADDQVVTPPATARLDGARNVVVQAVCPGARVGHGGLPREPVVVGLVLDALGPELVTAPGPADCAVLTAAGRAAVLDMSPQPS